MEKLITFKNLDDLTKYFKSESRCVAYFEQVRWNGQRTCPHCGAGKTYVLKGIGKYKCGECRKLFSITTGTYFEGTKLPLRKWLIAMYLCLNHKKGISSLQLASTIGVTQKTGWFVLHRIRAIVSEQVPQMLLSSVVEADETYIGGKEGNKHKDKKLPQYGSFSSVDIKENAGQGPRGKKVVLGLIERGGKVVTRFTPTASAANIEPFIKNHLAKGAILNTDEWHGYRRLKKFYRHEVIQHCSKIYVQGNVHTNTIENYWSGVKRIVNGTYHQISGKHLQKYLNEFSFRFNARRENNSVRFSEALKTCNGRLKYYQLIQKNS